MSRLISIFLIGITLLPGCSYRPDIIENTSLTITDKQQIFIVNHGWHTGIIIPASHIYSLLPDLQQRFSDNHYLEFGWGDKGFYQAEEITLGITLRAILWPSDSVMHVVGIDKNPLTYFSQSDIRSLCVSADGYARLVDFIRHSFQLHDHKISASQQGIYGDSQFYRGDGRYHLFNTCNNWSAKALASAGFDIFVGSKLTAGSIMGYVEHLESGECN